MGFSVIGAGVARGGYGEIAVGDGERTADARHAVVGVVPRSHVDRVRPRVLAGLAPERVHQRLVLDCPSDGCRKRGVDRPVLLRHVVSRDRCRTLRHVAHGRLGNRHVVVVGVLTGDLHVRGVDVGLLARAGVLVLERPRKAGNRDAVARHQVAGAHGGGHRRVGRAVVDLVLGCHVGGDGLLADRDLHILGCLGVGAGIRRRNGDVGLAVLRHSLDLEPAVGGCLDVALAAGLDGVADRAAALRGLGHASANDLVRVAVGGGHVLGGDDLLLLGDDRHGDVHRLRHVVVAVRGDGDVHLHGLARLGAGGGPQDAAFQRAAVRVAVDGVADRARRTVHADVCRKVDDASAVYGRSGRDRRRVGCLGDGELAREGRHGVVGVAPCNHVDAIRSHCLAVRTLDRVGYLVLADGPGYGGRELGVVLAELLGLVVGLDRDRARRHLCLGHVGNRHVVVLGIPSGDFLVRGVDGDELDRSHGSGVEGTLEAGDRDTVARHQVAGAHGGDHRRVGRAVVLLVLDGRLGGDALLGNPDLNVLGRGQEGVGSRRLDGDVGLTVCRNRLDPESAVGGHGDVVLAARLDGVGNLATLFVRQDGSHDLVRVAVGGLHVIGGDGLRSPRLDRHGDGLLQLLVVVVRSDGDPHGHDARVIGAVVGVKDAVLQRAAVRVATDHIAHGTRCAVQVDVACQVDGVAAVHFRSLADRREALCLGDGGDDDCGRRVIVVGVAHHAVEHGVGAGVCGRGHGLGPPAVDDRVPQGSTRRLARIEQCLCLAAPDELLGNGCLGHDGVRLSDVHVLVAGNRRVARRSHVVVHRGGASIRENRVFGGAFRIVVGVERLLGAVVHRGVGARGPCGHGNAMGLAIVGTVVAAGRHGELALGDG